MIITSHGYSAAVFGEVLWKLKLMDQEISKRKINLEDPMSKIPEWLNHEEFYKAYAEIEYSFGSGDAPEVRKAQLTNLATVCMLWAACMLPSEQAFCEVHSGPHFEPRLAQYKKEMRSIRKKKVSAAIGCPLPYDYTEEELESLYQMFASVGKIKKNNH